MSRKSSRKESVYFFIFVNFVPDERKKRSYTNTSNKKNNNDICARPVWNHLLPEKVNSYITTFIFACIYIFINCSRVRVLVCYEFSRFLFTWTWKMVGCGYTTFFRFDIFFGKRVLSIFTSTHFSSTFFSNFYENDVMLFKRKLIIVCANTWSEKKRVCMCLHVLVHFFSCKHHTQTRNCNV